MAESFDVGYGLSAVLFGALIGVVAIIYYVAKLETTPAILKMDAVLSFWLAYILTRPLGASMGDLLSQPIDAGGWGLGTVDTTVLFLLAILGLVVYLSRQQTKQPALPKAGRA